jgi:hypothetical protein
MPILLTREELMALPAGGPAWDALLARADSYQGGAALVDQNSTDNVDCLAAALVYARTRDPRYAHRAMQGVATVAEIARTGSYQGSTLPLSRNLGAFVIAAELVGGYADELEFDPLLTTPTTGQANVLASMERRPNNWGLHAAFSAACVYARGTSRMGAPDSAGLALVARAVRAWCGEGPLLTHSFGPLTWQPDPSNPVGVSPMHATIDGAPMDGMQPEEMRRWDGGKPDGPFSWPVPRTKYLNYSWEALQGATAAAWVLSMNGYPDVWGWGDRAILRAASWLVRVLEYPAEGDDLSIPWILSAAYGPSAFFLALDTPTTPGKSLGFFDWILGT